MTAVERIPLDVLLGNPDRGQPQISPDGKHLAWLQPVDGVLNVWVDDKPVTSDRVRGIRSYLWAHDGRHLLYVQDKGSDENWHLFTVDLISRYIETKLGK